MTKTLKPMKRFIIRKLYFGINGYNYYVHISTSVDGGKTFYYAGEGKYTINRLQALDFINQYIEDNKEAFIFENTGIKQLL